MSATRPSETATSEGEAAEPEYANRSAIREAGIRPATAPIHLDRREPITSVGWRRSSVIRSTFRATLA